MTGTASSSKRAATAAFADSNDNNNSKRQRLEQWGAHVAASINGNTANPQGTTAPCTFCGRYHSLAQCRGVLKGIKEKQAYQLAKRGGISKAITSSRQLLEDQQTCAVRCSCVQWWG